MSGFFLILLIVALIVVYSFIQVMMSISSSGGSASKFLSNFFKKTSPQIDDIYIDEATRPKIDKSIIRWRTFAGFLLGLMIMFLYAFYRGLSSLFNPWLEYLFWPLLIATVIAFVIMRKKEQELLTSRNSDVTKAPESERDN